MAIAGKIYKPRVSVFTPNGGSAYTIPGVVQMTETPSAEKRTTRADAAIGVTGIYTEGHTMQVTLQLEANEAATAAAGLAALFIGAAGKLEITTGEQAMGVDMVAGGEKKRTYPAASAHANSRAVVTAGPVNSAPVDGNPTVSITFDIFEAEGDRTKLVSVASP